MLEAVPRLRQMDADSPWSFFYILANEKTLLSTEFVLLGKSSEMINVFFFFFKVEHLYLCSSGPSCFPLKNPSKTTQYEYSYIVFTWKNEAFIPEVSPSALLVCLCFWMSVVTNLRRILRRNLLMESAIDQMMWANQRSDGPRGWYLTVNLTCRKRLKKTTNVF